MENSLKRPATRYINRLILHRHFGVSQVQLFASSCPLKDNLFNLIIYLRFKWITKILDTLLVLEIVDN